VSSSVPPSVPRPCSSSLLPLLLLPFAAGAAAPPRLPGDPHRFPTGRPPRPPQLGGNDRPGQQGPEPAGRAASGGAPAGRPGRAKPPLTLVSKRNGSEELARRAPLDPQPDDRRQEIENSREGQDGAAARLQAPDSPRSPPRPPKPPSAPSSSRASSAVASRASRELLSLPYHSRSNRRGPRRRPAARPPPAGPPPRTPSWCAPSGGGGCRAGRAPPAPRGTGADGLAEAGGGGELLGIGLPLSGPARQRVVVARQRRRSRRHRLAGGERAAAPQGQKAEAGDDGGEDDHQDVTRRGRSTAEPPVGACG